MQVESLESHLHELEESKKELTDHKYRSEAAIRELKAKFKSTEEVFTTNFIFYNSSGLGGETGILACSVLYDMGDFIRKCYQAHTYIASYPGSWSMNC